jgi:long-chain acyl-CoA synthetase
MRSAAVTNPAMEIDSILAAIPARFSHLARKWAEQTPGNLFIRQDGISFSYEAFWSAVTEAKSLLARHGVRGGDRVLLINENCIATVVMLHAISELDAWACIVNARLAAAEIETFRSLTGARLSIYTSGDSPAAAGHAGKDSVAAYERGYGRFDIGATNDAAMPEPVEAGKERQCGAIIFTSGTTGKAKAVMLSHQAVVYMGATMAIYRGVKAEDCFYIVVPISHVIGLGAALMAALWSGGSVEVAPRFQPEHLADALVKNRVSHLLGVSTMYRRLIDYGREQSLDLKSPRLKMLGAGGSPMDLALKSATESALGISLRNSYGMTEHNPIARTLEGAVDDAIGEIQPGVELRLVGPEGHDVARGEVGEIWVRGPSLMLGYYRDAEATRDALRPGGWLATGDLARHGENGLYIAGRSKDLIIRSGFNVYPAELEGIINRHPSVAASAVVGMEQDGSEEIVAFVQCFPGAECSTPALEDLVRAELAAYKRPGRFVFVESLPLGPTGKILKTELRRWAASGSQT